MHQVFNNYTLTEDNFSLFLESIFGDTSNKTLVDLCSHHGRQTTKLPLKHLTLVDYYDYTEDHIKQVNCHGKVKNHNSISCDITSSNVVQDILHKHSPDIVTCLDGIEHLSKDDGLNLIYAVANYANNVLFFTPLGDLWIDNQEDEVVPFRHKSGWVPEDLPDNWAKIIFPNYHETLGCGAWFFWKTEDTQESFNRACKFIQGGF